MGTLKKRFGKLSILSGPGAGSFFFLFKERHTIGRGDENPITVYETSVSRIHCRIHRSAGKYFLTDLNATNGTFLNGEKLRPNQHYALEAGSYIHLGNAELFFTIETIELDPMDAVHESLAAMPSTEDAGDLFTDDTFKDEATAEIEAEAISKGRRVSSTIPFNIFSSKNLVAIYRILGAIGAVNDRQQLMDKSLSIVAEVMRAERGILFLVDDYKGGKVKPAAMTARKGTEGISASDLNSPLMKKVLGKGIPMLCSGVPEELKIPGAGSLPAGTVVSAMCAPLQSRERIFGAIYVDAPANVRDFAKDDMELLSAIGLHLGALMENVELSLRNQELFLGVIRTLIYIIEAKDKYTLGHSERVTRISLAVADEIGLGYKEKEALRVSGLIHDIGKIIIPEEILNKPGKLSAEEILIIKKHPVVGYNFVEHLAGFDEVRNGILFHHERVDGAGYPNALIGKAIPVIAKIIAVADAFDAMTSNRPYRKGFSEEDAIKELVANKGTQFDQDVVDAFVQAYIVGKINLEKKRVIPIPRSEKPPEPGSS